jgi:hypothetical protein
VLDLATAFPIFGRFRVKYEKEANMKKMKSQAVTLVALTTTDTRSVE